MCRHFARKFTELASIADGRYVSGRGQPAGPLFALGAADAHRATKTHQDEAVEFICQMHTNSLQIPAMPECGEQWGQQHEAARRSIVGVCVRCPGVVVFS